MTVFFGSLSILCLIYYGVIAVYSGVRTSFSAVWLVMAFCLAVMAAVSHFYGRFKDRIPLPVSVSVITVIMAFFVVFVSVEVAIGLNFFSFDKQSVDYLIVLGTQVKGDEISNSLRFRLETALRYAEIHPNTVLILSGGQGEGENVSEASAMYDYLREHGVPEYQMIKEESSTSTYENMVYSGLIINAREADRRNTIRNVMHQAGFLVPPDDQLPVHVGIVTSNFHLLRAKAIAKKVGFQDAHGIAAKSDPVLFVHFCVRECFAILKDKFMGNM